eukprot:Phypoly_transcript_09816.p1 GENE.Phypoly_transcript_09816~~Phypoly_transcript_09816.p1  ORF type:complete len:402 (+),score=24.50 Phypoly_transcript_09816:84-1289(+)
MHREIVFLILGALCVQSCKNDICTADWECGNPIYWNCVRNHTAPPCHISLIKINRIAISLTHASPNSTVYLLKDGKRELVVPENEPTLAGSVVFLLAVNSEAIYVTKATRENNAIVEFSYNRTSIQSEVVTQVVRGYTWTAAFNERKKVAYVCLGGAIVRYNSLVITENDRFNSTTYSLQPAGCSILRLDGSTNSLYWYAGTSFYRGNASCVNCPLPAPFFNTSDGVEDFQVDKGHLYVAAYGIGIKAISLANLNRSKIIVSNAHVLAFQIADGHIYYNDGEIKRVKLDGSNPKTISKTNHSSPTNGSCECEDGFTGSNCDSCRGSVQWHEGKIHCVPFNTTTGFPVSCFSDYMCGNVPYAKCVKGACECQTGPLGVPPYCDRCSNGGPITWHNGIPSCPK